MKISHEPLVKEPADFSLVLGGPLYQLWRGTRLADDTLHLLHRRVLAMVLVAWVPLLLLSIAEGHAWGTMATLPFLRDVELHVRLLLAVPLLTLAAPVLAQGAMLAGTIASKIFYAGATPPEFKVELTWSSTCPPHLTST